MWSASLRLKLENIAYGIPPPSKPSLYRTNSLQVWTYKCWLVSCKNPGIFAIQIVYLSDKNTGIS